MSKGELPPHRIEVCNSIRREGGQMVFNVRPGGAFDLTGNVGWILGVDRHGKFPFSLKFDTPAQAMYDFYVNRVRELSKNTN